MHCSLDFGLWPLFVFLMNLFEKKLKFFKHFHNFNLVSDQKNNFNLVFIKLCLFFLVKHYGQFLNRLFWPFSQKKLV